MTDDADAVPVLPGGLPSVHPFAMTSRYYLLPLAAIDVGGETVRYVTRRFVPDPSRFVGVRDHTVGDDERPDTLAAQYIGDPEQFWRLCDANRVLRPNELTETIGRVVHITLPEGVPGASNA